MYVLFESYVELGNKSGSMKVEMNSKIWQKSFDIKRFSYQNIQSLRKSLKAHWDHYN